MPQHSPPFPDLAQPSSLIISQVLKQEQSFGKCVSEHRTAWAKVAGLQKAHPGWESTLCKWGKVKAGGSLCQTTGSFSAEEAGLYSLGGTKFFEQEEMWSKVLPRRISQHEHVRLVRGGTETRKLVRSLTHSGDKQPPQSQESFLVVTPNIDVHFL